MLKVRKIFVLSLLIGSIVINSSNAVVSYAAGSGNPKPEITYAYGPVGISEKGWAKSDNVIIASGKDFPDALSGSPFAIAMDAPILYTDSASELNGIFNFNRGEIERLGAKRAYMLGGTGVISVGIEQELKSFGIEIVRISGKDRYETAKKIGDELMKVKKTNAVFLASASDFPDAAAVSIFAGQNGFPIVLTGKNSLNPVTDNALREWNIKTVYIAGGTGVISQGVEDTLKKKGITVKRLAGKNRYETAKTIINNFKAGTDSLVIASGQDFKNALAGSVYGYKTNKPVMLFDKNTEESIKEFVWNKKSLVCFGTYFSEADMVTKGSMSDSIAPYGVVRMDLSKLLEVNEKGETLYDDREFFMRAGISVTNSPITYNSSYSFEEHMENLRKLFRLHGASLNIGSGYWDTLDPDVNASREYSPGRIFKARSDMYNGKYVGKPVILANSWRRSYEWSNKNESLNLFMEQYKYFLGDEAGEDLWAAIDSAYINRTLDAGKFDFTEIVMGKGTSSEGDTDFTIYELTHKNGAKVLWYDAPENMSTFEIIVLQRGK
jgi:putative cell wall-binding protein